MNYGVGVLAVIAAAICVANLTAYGNDAGGLWSGGLILSIAVLFAMLFL